MNIHPLFSSYVAKDSIQADNSKLEEYCYNIKETGTGRQVSNQGGWQSELIYKVEDVMRDVYLSATERANTLNKSVGFDGGPVRMQSFWININENGHYNEVHDHPGSFYAGVYYVNAKELQGDIVFYHPMPFFSNYLNANKPKDFTQFNAVNWKFTPKTGDLYIFPSYLNHFVRRNMTNENRVSIAFNFGIDMRRS